MSYQSKMKGDFVPSPAGRGSLVSSSPTTKPRQTSSSPTSPVYSAIDNHNNVIPVLAPLSACRLEASNRPTSHCTPFQLLDRSMYVSNPREKFGFKRRTQGERLPDMHRRSGCKGQSLIRNSRCEQRQACCAQARPGEQVHEAIRGYDFPAYTSHDLLFAIR